MNRRVSHLIAGWRTGLSRPVLILQGGNALNYFGYGLVLRLARSELGVKSWCSPIAINGGPRTPIVDAANGFISAFPDIQVHMDDLIFKDETVEFHWTFTGTNTGSGGSGKSVRISGFEEWTSGDSTPAAKIVRVPAFPITYPRFDGRAVGTSRGGANRNAGA